LRLLQRFDSLTKGSVPGSNPFVNFLVTPQPGVVSPRPMIGPKDGVFNVKNIIMVCVDAETGPGVKRVNLNLL
jgi:hypothetical protein